MKKTAAALIALLLIVSLTIPVFADLGQPEFDDWYLWCGMDGYDTEAHVIGYNPDGPNEWYRHIEPGERFQVHSFYNGSYMVMALNDNGGYEYSISLTEKQMETYFLERNDVVDKSEGTKLPNAVKGKVNAQNGLILRQGPSTGFASYENMPIGTELTYQYTVTAGGRNWGYVTYRGKNGWCCIDYLDVIEEKTDTKEDKEPETRPEENKKEEDTAKTGSSDTKMIILYVLIGALGIAIGAFACLKLLKK